MLFKIWFQAEFSALSPNTSLQAHEALFPEFLMCSSAKYANTYLLGFIHAVPSEKENTRPQDMLLVGCSELKAIKAPQTRKTFTSPLTT